MVEMTRNCRTGASSGVEGNRDVVGEVSPVSLVLHADEQRDETSEVIGAVARIVAVVLQIHVPFQNRLFLAVHA